MLLDGRPAPTAAGPGRPGAAGPGGRRWSWPGPATTSRSAWRTAACRPTRSGRGSTRRWRPSASRTAGTPPTGALSGGEQQRLALAGDPRAAARPAAARRGRPRTSTRTASRWSARLSRRVARAPPGATAVIVEHRVEQVGDLVDRAVVARARRRRGRRRPPAEVFGRAGRRAGRGRRVGAGPASCRTSPSPRPPGAGPWSPPRPCASATRHRARDALADARPRPAGRRGARAHRAERRRQVDPGAVLAGLLAPTAGEVSVADGADPASGPPTPTPPTPDRAAAVPLAGATWSGRVGTVFQDPEHQFVTSTVRDELALGPAGPAGHAAAGRPRRRAAGAARPGRSSPRPTRTRCPAARSGGCRWRPRSRPRRAWSSPTSRPSGRIAHLGRSWSSCSPTCVTPGTPCAT